MSRPTIIGKVTKTLIFLMVLHHISRMLEVLIERLSLYYYSTCRSNTCKNKYVDVILHYLNRSVFRQRLTIAAVETSCDFVIQIAPTRCCIWRRHSIS